MACAYSIYYYESRCRSYDRGLSQSQSQVEGLKKLRDVPEEEWTAFLESRIKSAEKRLKEAHELERENSWNTSLECTLIMWWPWLLLTPLIVFCCQRFPFKKNGWIAPLLLHILCGAAIGAVKLNMEYYFMVHIAGEDDVIIGYGNASINLGIYFIFVLAYNGLTYYKRFQERELKTSRLKAQLAQAQLQALKMQLHPHFLFNTLHAISTLMMRDVETADNMITRLSDLLRMSLQKISQQENPLKEELEFLNCYLDIEKMRLGDDLEFINETDPNTLDAIVPVLMLQPLVENAIQHGISRIDIKGRILLRTRTNHNRLIIEVCDNGPGMAGERMGIGLSNTRARLNQLYGENGELKFFKSDEDGFTAQLSLPLKGREP